MPEQPVRSAITLRLLAGTNPDTGNQIVRNVSLGRVVRNADADKVLAVANALASCLAHPIGSIRRTEVTTIEA